jgi:hypothetical protein
MNNTPNKTYTPQYQSTESTPSLPQGSAAILTGIGIASVGLLAILATSPSEHTKINPDNDNAFSAFVINSARASKFMTLPIHNHNELYDVVNWYERQGVTAADVKSAIYRANDMVVSSTGTLQFADGSKWIEGQTLKGPDTTYFKNHVPRSVSLETPR